MTDIACGAASAHARKSNKRRLLDIGIVGLLGAGLIATASAAQAANAGISQVTILSSGPAFGGCSIGNVGTFTVIKGYALDLIDPADSHNTDITDIALAPKDANGYVNLLLSFYMTVPSNLANGNGKIVADIPNRGNVEIASPNRSAGGNAYGSSATNCNGTTGTGTFWWPQGYSIVDAGWEYAGDPTSAANTSLSASGVVLPVNGTPVATTTMPIAMNAGNTTITGPGYEYIVATGPTGATNGTGTTTYVLGGVSTPSYPATPLGGANSCSGNGVLTHRKHLDDTPTVLDPSDWQYNIGSDGNCDSISLLTTGSGPGTYYSACTASTGGNVATGACFIGQDIYELSYTAANPTVNGLGVIAIRDFYSWLKGNSGTAAQSNNPFSPGYIQELYT
ncbi:MAG TPA: hypothetical protein VHX39_22905, partial [Acetobacteraceae bacterium]|nr:hypothetical protein [Acetobacteraceae bacterium]